MNLLVGQKEALPDIAGNAAYIVFRGGATYDYADGALGPLLDQAFAVNFASGSTFQARKIEFRASRTSGTGSGVYKWGAHVQSNNISCKSWLRNA